MNRFKNLKVWQEAIELAVDAYKITATFPKEEKFGLISQIQRASVSVSSNIAEGAGRNNKGEFNQFLGIAQGSLCEVESLFHLSSRLELLNLEEIQPTNDRIDGIQRMIISLQSSLNINK